ncbi:sensor histidine kinase [Paenibacillus sp. P96]|uniref:histidine kinase n=1 Tax=Paenibacillus zeirhizosphaerae TaxID=2987519 RepID=A0ABT9FQW6_9BACL|nr:sensor histidine kinase [Paenibacillus sp. P96]MDP4097133.1 sensor histidine kinase [Paenibacillus sp. P96]
MSLLHYLEQKRFFLLFYLGIALFVTLMIAVCSSPDMLVDNIVYTNLGCALLAAAYIIIGYFYRNAFYHELQDMLHMKQQDMLAVLPQPKDPEQKLYLQLLKAVLAMQLKELEQLHADKKDHQDFIMSWIHEVKLPITASRLLISNSSGKSADYLADKFEDELGKIDNLVDQTLYYSRLDSFSKDYLIAEVSLHSVVKESIRKHSKLFIHKHIQLNLWEEPQNVHTDSKWLGFVVDQILSNALKYTRNGGTISFSYAETTREKQLHIHDTGIGIKPEDLPRVFDRGFTGFAGRSYAKSTGMGLYLAKNLALKLGHDLSIQSSEGQSTTVTIHFFKNSSYHNVWSTSPDSSA